MKCFVFGKVTFVRQVASESGALRLYLSVHDGLRTSDFVIFEYNKNFRSNEMTMNPVYKSIVENGIKAGCYVNIMGNCYYSNSSQSIVFKPFAIFPVKESDLERCSALGLYV
jgi:hypothetical protein